MSRMTHEENVFPMYYLSHYLKLWPFYFNCPPQFFLHKIRKITSSF